MLSPPARKVGIWPNAAESAAPEPFARPVSLNPPAARLASSGPSRFAVGPVGLVTVKSVDVSVVMPLPPDGVAQSAAVPDVAVGTWPTVGVPVMITPSTPATFRFVDGPVGSVTVTVESVEVMVEIVPLPPPVDLRKPLTLHLPIVHPAPEQDEEEEPDPPTSVTQEASHSL